MVKNFEDIFIRFDMIHERDRRTDRQAPHADIYRAYAYALRGKKCNVNVKYALEQKFSDVSAGLCAKFRPDRLGR